MAARVALQAAYVLHRRPYRDSSLIIDVLTRDHGRVALVARGARRAGSRLRGLLQLFRPLLVSWSGRGELGTLTGAEGHGGGSLQGGSLINGFYVNELLMRLLPRHDPHPGLYLAYEAVLARLAGTFAEERVSARYDERALRLFEKALLNELGYGLALEQDAEGGAPIEPDALYYYYPERGAVSSAAASAAAARHEGAVKLHGRSLLALAHDALEDERSLREAKRLMRATLGVYLGDRPLNSRALLRGVGGGRSAVAGQPPASSTDMTMEEA